MSLRIHEVLKEKGKTQKWLAEQLDVTEPGMNLIIKERVNVPLRRLEQIAEILEVNILELFEDYKETIRLAEDYKNVVEQFEQYKAESNNCTKGVICPHCQKEIEIIVSAK